MSELDKNYYDILEIPTTASQQEINQGYIRSKNAYSQDSLAMYSIMTFDECAKMIEQIEEAFSILSDPDKRRKYDQARGIASVAKPVSIRIPTQASHMPKDVVSSSNIVKKVASKKFILDYKVDADFEVKIESTTEFTGAFLKQIREYKKVTLDRLSDMTKVSKTYLMNIEEESFENLPATVYVRGFVFQYAKCLKLNPDLVATSFLYRLKKARNEA